MQGTGFFDVSMGDDPSPMQHLYWLLGHPRSWLMILVWIFILSAAFMIARWLFKKRRIYSVFLFLAAVVGLAYIYWSLFSEGMTLYASGQGHAAYQIRIANWIVLFLGFASAVWMICLRVLKARKQKSD